MLRGEAKAKTRWTNMCVCSHHMQEGDGANMAVLEEVPGGSGLTDDFQALSFEVLTSFLPMD